MSSKITVIPTVKAQGIKILNIKTGETTFANLDNIFPDGETIDITWNRGQENQKEKIWKEIEPRLIDRLDEIKNYGLSEYGLDNGAESEPIVIDIGDSEEYLAQNYGTILRGNYRVIQIDNTKYTNTLPIRLDRIFLSAPPRLALGDCEFFQPDPDDLLKFDDGKEASCGFQYFYQNFKKDTSRSKFVEVKEQRERKLPDGTKAKSSFDKIKYYCENDPPQFEIWSKLYQNFLSKRLSKKINTVDNETAQEIVRAIPEISIINLNPTEWTKEELHNSMSIEDIVRMCMWMDLNLEIYDDIDELVLCYSRDQQLHKQYKKIKKRGSVVVKVKDNHGYFVKNGDPVKCCVAGTNYSHTAFYPNDGMVDCNINDSKKVEIDTTDTNIIKHPRCSWKGSDIYNWGEAFETGELPQDPTEEDFRKYKNKIEAPYLADNPPPNPEELIGMMSENTLYFTGTNCLNGLVDYLKRYHNIQPDRLRGGTTSIKRATYGKLNIYTANSRPDIHYRPPDLDGGLDTTENIDTEEAEQKCIDDWKERYPQLKVSSIPAPSQIGQAIFNEFNIDCYSCFNSRMRDILFNAEIKPYYRATPPTHDFACAFSLDFSKAYSNALRFMDCKWCVFDAIDEPTEFKEFNENNFYLVEELETGFPYKDLKGKGLALYHGCLLRHLRDKVIIKYQLTCHKLLPPDTFVRFVDKCYELAGDGKDNIVSAKQLVNQTLGNLKRKSGIKDYKLYLNTGVSQINKHLFDGLPVYNLDKGGTWKNTNYITAMGNIQHNFMSGQPIRLQVIDRINELNLLLDTAVRKSLNRDIHLILEKTDALYYQYPDGAKYSFKDYYWNDFSFNPVKDLDLDKINSELPDGYEVKIEKPLQGSGVDNQPIKVNIEDWNKLPTEINQYPVLSFRRKWKPYKVYKHRWDAKVEVPKILKNVVDNDGLFISGEAGTGKTEIIKGIDSICNRNKIRLRWIRAFHKIVKGSEANKYTQEWKKSNPCFMRKFAPTNKACNNIGGQTLHRGLGLKIINNSLIDDEEDDEEETVDIKNRTEKLIKLLETKSPDIAVFDEVGMIGGDGWSLISYIKYRIPSIKIILCGDIERQLAPVGEEDRKFNNSICIKEVVNYNKINLVYNFRRNGGTNRLWTDWSINPQRFKVDDLPLTERNICYTNKTRKEVIDLVQDSHPDPVLWLDCNVGEDKDNTGCNNRLMIAYDTPLIARVSMKERGVAKNEIWRVDKIGNDTGLTEGCHYGLSSLESDGVIIPMICLKYKDKEEWFSHDDIKKYWLSAYCITIHKAQGDTYDDEYTIWDWELLSKYRNYNTRRLRYVAQSRSTNPETLIRYK